MSFSELGLSPDVCRAVADAGYATPTPIQAQAIPVVLQGRDVLGCAQTGTGKTAGFTLPMIDRLAVGRARARMPRSLILEPTRELAAQVAESFDKYGKYHRLTKALLIGGVSFGDQDTLIDRGVDVLIATPGRLLDHFGRGRLLLHGVDILVVDEADRMLDMGFIPDVEKIVSLIPPRRQTLFFSATMPPEIRRLADAFLSAPKEITVAPPASPAATVQQSLVMASIHDKREALRRLLRAQDVKNAFIFCNRKRDVDILFKSLKKHGFDVAALHGDLSQEVRTQTLERFKAGEITLLVCSDVAARGLDVQGMSHVFNFDVPSHAEDYVHRIGRTGRAGMTGTAITLVTPHDGKYLAAITRLIGREIERQVLPGLDPVPVDPEEPNHRERAPRDGRSRRGGRGQRERGHEPRAELPPAQLAPASSPLPQPRAEPAPVRPPPEARPARESRASREHRRGERREARDEQPVKGLGDHVPAFLLRPAFPPRRDPDKTEPTPVPEANTV
jgi:superfamily II DNA/RNA helicase